MLKLFDKNHNAIGHIVKYKDCRIESDVATGDKTLSFVYLARHHSLQNEMYIQTKTDEYVIKEVPDSTSGFSQIVAILNLEDLQRDMWQTFSVTDTTIDEAVKTVLAGTGWTIGHCDVIKKRNAGMMQVSTLGVIQNLCTAFMCEPAFDTINKTVSFYEQRGEDKGVYFMSGLNLKKLQKKSNSYDYYTRIIPVGQNGLTIESVNDGKNYLENYQYSNKVLTYIWKDESYTDAQALIEDAYLKLEDLSKPVVSYQASVRDLANQKTEYSILAYGIGDTVTIIDQQTGTREKQRIKKMTEYPQNPEKNTCEIANTTLTFEEMQRKYQDAAAIINCTVAGDGRYTGTINVSDILKFEQGVAGSSTIAGINHNISDMQGEVALLELTVGSFEANYIKSEVADLKYATIEQAEILSANIHNLEGDYVSFRTGEFEELKAAQAQFESVATNDFTAIDAEIENLRTHQITTEYLDANYAAIDLANILTGSIKTAMIETGAVQTAQIADGSITDAKIVELTANKITAGILSVERLEIRGSTNSLVYALNDISGALQAQSVDTLNGEILTPRSITADRIVAQSITGDEIAAKTITGNNIVANTITGSNIAANTITGNNIAASTITGNKIAANTITGSNIAADSITATEINVDDLFAQDITATGTIRGIRIEGATGSFTGTVDATSLAVKNDLKVYSVDSSDYESVIKAKDWDDNYKTVLFGFTESTDAFIQIEKSIASTGGHITLGGTYTDIYLNGYTQANSDLYVLGEISEGGQTLSSKYAALSDLRNYLALSGGTVNGQLVLSKTTDGGLDASDSALIIGDPTGQHLLFDPNEIMAKSDATTSRTLQINVDGGNVGLSGNTFVASQDGVNDTTAYLAIADGSTSTFYVNGKFRAQTSKTAQISAYVGNSVAGASINVNAAGVAGLYSSTHSKWMIRTDSSGTVTCSSSSDRRLKNDLGVIPRKEALMLLRGIKNHKFVYKNDPTEVVQYGMMAQDLRDVLLDRDIGYRTILQIDSWDGNQIYTDLRTPEELVQYSIDYSKMVPILHDGWQIHDDRLNTLESTICSYESDFAQIQSRLETAENRIEELEAENRELKNQILALSA